MSVQDFEAAAQDGTRRHVERDASRCRSEAGSLHVGPAGLAPYDEVSNPPVCVCWREAEREGAAERNEAHGRRVTAAAVNRKWPKQGSARRSAPPQGRRKRTEHEMGKISFTELFVIRHAAVILVDTGGPIVISLNSTAWELRRYSAYQKYGRRTGR